MPKIIPLRELKNASKILETRHENNEPGFFEYIADRDSKKLYSIAELKQILSPIFEKHKVKKATLFGSYVKGTADTRSDIDIVVETNLKGWDFYGLLGEITDALRFPVDLIEKRTIKKGSDFEKEINNTGVTIYEKE